MPKTKKIQYFDPQLFIDKVMRECDFGHLDKETRESLDEAITIRLAERIVATVIDNFTGDEFVLLEKVMEDHPELDDIDAIMIISSRVPDLQVKLEKAMSDLYKEMVYNVSEIGKAVQHREYAFQAMNGTQASSAQST